MKLLKKVSSMKIKTLVVLVLAGGIFLAKMYERRRKKSSTEDTEEKIYWVDGDTKLFKLPTKNDWRVEGRDANGSIISMKLHVQELIGQIAIYTDTDDVLFSDSVMNNVHGMISSFHNSN